MKVPRLLASLLVLLIGCDGSLERARTTLRVGYAVEAPYAWINAEGRVTGESPEVLRVVANRLGVGSIEWRQVDFSKLIEELREGKVDVVASGLFITPERQKLVRFSRPTFRVREAFLVRQGNPRAPGALAPTPGATPVVAVVAGAYEEILLVDHGWSPEALYRVPDALTGLRTVESGRVDALMLSSPTLRTMARQHQGLEVRVPEGSPGQLGGFAFRTEDEALVRAWDEVLENYIGSPEHLSVVSPLGFTSDDLP